VPLSRSLFCSIISRHLLIEHCQFLLALAQMKQCVYIGWSQNEAGWQVRLTLTSPYTANS
jgi:hypothetical protein